eukprot:scaffold123709_cov69-Phaeocystis_antarctica.AAC.5
MTVLLTTPAIPPATKYSCAFPMCARGGSGLWREFGVADRERQGNVARVRVTHGRVLRRRRTDASYKPSHPSYDATARPKEAYSLSELLGELVVELNRRGRRVAGLAHVVILTPPSPTRLSLGKRSRRQKRCSIKAWCNILPALAASKGIVRRCSHAGFDLQELLHERLCRVCARCQHGSRERLRKVKGQ